MTWALAIAGGALCVAGGALCVAGDVSNDTAVYLWVPGMILIVLAFARATRPKPDPRPGYIHNREDR